MAKSKRRARKSGKRHSASGQHGVGKHRYGSREFECYGKHVRSNKSTKRVPRIFCGKTK